MIVIARPKSVSRILDTTKIVKDIVSQPTWYQYNLNYFS